MIKKIRDSKQTVILLIFIIFMLKVISNRCGNMAGSLWLIAVLIIQIFVIFLRSVYRRTSK